MIDLVIYFIRLWPIEDKNGIYIYVLFLYLYLNEFSSGQVIQFRLLLNAHDQYRRSLTRDEIELALFQITANVDVWLVHFLTIVASDQLI